MLKSKQGTELLKLSFAGMHGSLSYAYFLVCQHTSKYGEQQSSSAMRMVIKLERYILYCVLWNGNAALLLLLSALLSHIPLLQ